MAKKYIRNMSIRIINLNKWFPENDNLSTGMARLCILREDFLFELQTWIESELVPIDDEYGPDWRRLYFFRRMCVTVKEICTALEALLMKKEFKHFLRRQPNDFVKNFKSFKMALNRALDTIDPIRDEISAHIKQSSIEQALRQMRDAQRSGRLQISFEKPSKTHYKFTDELLMAIMFKDIPPSKQEEEAKERVDIFLLGVKDILETVDMIFHFYARERGLDT
jgi:hypothetical protein